ncbi:hypothetical protein TraAM80_07324 [Trypanosoma rangeli]|uniref:Uncharacterized protein n=1 Tax=Trypanosoma rangeli TaxID=5698 RepID=A0A3S5IQL1_TRYRA|nr:uncharacterized protein TraAM80_07324 [Trypanosoma rangeli]RNF00905.1 hypothetical protein TraAM80_07324 [Trypanosoma rangeli]|eukprot:RNF00905.1 hypothetical protein TraAM80_07324 [Trypanosoma rangeli]
MRNGSQQWDPGVALGLQRGDWCHAFPAFSRMLCGDDVSARPTTAVAPAAAAITPTVASLLMPSMVCSSSSCDTVNASMVASSREDGGGGGMDVAGKDAGAVFQEKIRLLRKSMQEQRAAREQQRREWDRHEQLETTQPSAWACGVPLKGDGSVVGPGCQARRNEMRDAAAQTQPAPPLFALPNSSAETGRTAMSEGDDEVAMSRTTPSRGNERLDAGKDETDAMDLSTSPVVVVVVDESPHAVEHRDSAVTTAKGAAFSSPVDAQSRAVAVPHGDDGDGSEAGRDDAVHGTRAEKKRTIGRILQGVGATIQAVEVSQSSTPRSTKHRQHHTLVSPLVTADVAMGKKFSASHGVDGPVGGARRRQAIRKQVTAIHTLRAPSESSTSRLSIQRCTHETSLQSLSPPSDTETKQLSGNSDEGEEEWAPRRSTRRSAALEDELERLTEAGTGGTHALFRGTPSVSSENTNTRPVRVNRGRSVTRGAAAAEAALLTGSRMNDCTGAFTALRSCSPNLMRTLVKEDVERVTSTSAHSRSSCGVGEISQRRTTGEGSAAARQRRCLLRQIRLIDAEIHRMEQLPWFKSLRTASASANTLRREKSRLLALRTRYKWELERVAERGEVRQTGPPPPPPLPAKPYSLLPSSRRRSQEESPALPRHGPSVYESVLQQQGRQRQQHARNLLHTSQMTVKQMTLRPTAGGPSAGRRNTSIKGNDLPPTAGASVNARPHANCGLSGEHLSLPRGSITTRNSDKFHVVNNHRTNNRVGCRRSLSIDAERMAALYARSASSSQSTWRDGTPTREPMGSVSRRSNSYVASSGASVHEKNKEVPLYWRLTQVRRDLDAHNSSNVRDMSGFRSSCGSASPSPVRIMRPLQVHSRGRDFWRVG